jgi:S-DNA-T family DNA segregation ATPase FtsK/SpoIIIE
MGLLAILEEHFFLPVMKRQSKKLSTDQMIQLGHGLELWNRHLAQFLGKALGGQKREIETLLAEIFHNPEERIQTVCDLKDGGEFRVTGKYDALLFDPSAGEAVVMEFKGHKAGCVEEDFLQIVLYCWLVKTATGITPRGTVFYLEEDEPEVHYSAEDINRAMQNLSELFRQVIHVKNVARENQTTTLPSAPHPELCMVCEFDPRCDQDWGPRKTEVTSPGDPEIEKATEEAEESQVSLLNALNALKLGVEPLGYIAGPRFVRFKIKPLLQQGVTVKKLMNQAENLQVELGLHVAPLIQPQAGYVSIDVPRKIRVPLTLGMVWRKGERSRPQSKVAFPIGMSIDGSIVWADLSDPAMTSVLVGGTAGSGKSVFLRAVTIGLALNAKPRDVQITLIDPKRVSFTDLASLPHLSGAILMDNDPALEKLAQLVDEMEERYRMFEKMRVADINAYNQVTGPLSHQVVMIDEYADLIIDKNTKEQMELSVQRLGQKGRAGGIHLILATQRPDSKVVTPIIKANLQLKVALKVTTATNSAVILDQTGAEYLIGHGDMIVGGSIPVQRLQGSLVTRTEIEVAMQNK